MRKLLCRWFGHKPKASELKRSPYTVYTHWRDITCARCGADIRTEREYHDARTEPHLFRAEAT